MLGHPCVLPRVFIGKAESTVLLLLLPLVEPFQLAEYHVRQFEVLCQESYFDGGHHADSVDMFQHFLDFLCRVVWCESGCCTPPHNLQSPAMRVVRAGRVTEGENGPVMASNPQEHHVFCLG